ncbi:NTP transferase domain-containing protein, partial [bacterium]|nr:NTP transferase domain-containing protein [bacterium]
MNNKSVNTAVILAGGKGTRIKSVHPDLPKPLIPISGKPFLQWQIEYLKSYGVNRIILSIGYMAEKIIDYFTENPVENVEIIFAIEEKPLGTGGAVKFVAEKYDLGWAFVCNGDTLCPADLNAVKKIDKCRAAILVSKKEDVTDYGSVLTDENDGIIAFMEKGEKSGEGWVNAGMYLIDLEWAK